MGHGVTTQPWPVCGAPTLPPELQKDQRPHKVNRHGPICRGAGDGYGGRCRWHGGLVLPPGEWTLLYLGTGLYVVPWVDGEPSDSGKGGGYRVSWRTAAALVQGGQIGRGVFFRTLGKGLLGRLRANGVAVKVVSRHRYVSEYSFEVAA